MEWVHSQPFSAIQLLSERPRFPYDLGLDWDRGYGQHKSRNISNIMIFGTKYEVIIVGGGHVGTEAALASARD